MSDLKKANAFVLNDIEEMNVCAAVEHTDENEDLPALTGNETSQELLDYMVLVICRHLHTRVVFKSAEILEQLLGKPDCKLCDSNSSISDEDGYLKIIQFLKQIAVQFQNAGIILDYKIKDTITPSSSGGIDFYNKVGKKILGINIDLFSLDYNVTTYNIRLDEENIFMAEKVMAEKITTILLNKGFQQTKDIYDLFVLSKNSDINIQRIAEFVKISDSAICKSFHFSDERIVQCSKVWNKLVLRTSVSQHIFKPTFRDAWNNFYSLVFAILDAKNIFPIVTGETISEKFAIDKRYTICGACALHRNGLIFYSAERYDFMTAYKEIDGTNLLYLSYYYSDTIDDINFTKVDPNDPLILVPTKERAIVEYIKNEKWCDEGILIEALKSYLMWFRNDEELYKVAEHFKVPKETIDYWINEALTDEEI